MHGKFGLLSQGKASSHSTAQPSCCFFLCAVFCFRNPPNSDIWTTGSLTCVRSYACVYTGGWGTLTMSQDQHFDSEKLSQICLVLWTGFEPLVMESIGSRGWRSHPSLLLYRYKRSLLENVSTFSYLGIRNAWDPCSRGSTFLSVEPNSWSKLLTDSMFVNK